MRSHHTCNMLRTESTELRLHALQPARARLHDGRRTLLHDLACGLQPCSRRAAGRALRRRAAWRAQGPCATLCRFAWALPPRGGVRAAQQRGQRAERAASRRDSLLRAPCP